MDLNAIKTEEHEALVDRCESWKALAKALDSLLVCYRVGQNPSGRLLDKIRTLKDRLGYDNETTEKAKVNV